MCGFVALLWKPSLSRPRLEAGEERQREREREAAETTNVRTYSILTLVLVSTFIVRISISIENVWRRIEQMSLAAKSC